ncbi:MAG TPA: alpha/beta fold hydrolase [Pseudonocardiaceae bacterium]|nr:alpha/beta fold hydrolase [Pseudonocardiaceae bacterium]
MNPPLFEPGPWRLSRRSPLRMLVTGDGAPVVLFHGFAMCPEIYAATARSIAAHGHSVFCPDLFSLRGRWSAKAVVDAVADTLDDLGIQQALMISHSFGGGIQLDLAVAHPELIGTLVFADTLGLSREMRLAREAVHPSTLVRLASRPAAYSFARVALRHPAELARAAWWGFTSDRRQHASVIARRGTPSQVIWAERDTLLRRSEGREFARSLGAGFHLLCGDDGRGPVDHDAMFRHPELFVRTLESIGVLASGAVRGSAG